MDKIAKALTLASAKVGTKELTGKNDGPFMDECLKVCGLDNQKYMKDTGKGYAWCAAFVSWVLTQVDPKIKPNAWSPAWFVVNKLVSDRKPMDCFGVNYNNIENGHIGFILYWPEEGDTFLSLEGNWGNCVGINVRKKTDVNSVSRWL